jgi:hypothetical protein
MSKPRFPGFKACMQMMRRHAPQVQEEGFHLLLPRAAEFVEPLIAELAWETDHGLRCWLLELLGEARDPRALPVLLDALRSGDDALTNWGVRSLQKLGTAQARRALFDAGHPTTPGGSTGQSRRRG